MLNYVEYGKENSDVIILLHGGGLSWWNYKEVAERLQTDYHVVLPILDGHAGCDKQFTTIENNALDIIEFVNSKLGGSEGCGCGGPAHGGVRRQRPVPRGRHAPRRTRLTAVL